MVCAPVRHRARRSMWIEQSRSYTRTLLATSPLIRPTRTSMMGFGSPIPPRLVWTMVMRSSPPMAGSFALPVPVTTDDDGHSHLDVLALLPPINAMAQAAADPSYNKVFRIHRTLRFRRFDWCIGISTTSHAPTGSQLAWHELTFPGRPARRATEQRPFCPGEGYAAAGLCNRRADRPIDELLRRFLVSFLECNGYHDFQGAIADVLDAWRESEPEQRAQGRRQLLKQKGVKAIP